MDLLSKSADNLTGTEYTGLRVRAMVADYMACGHYRVINPAWYLQKRGADIKYFVTCRAADVLDGDIIIAQRQYSSSVANTILAECIRQGKLVIYEADDNFHAVSNTSPVYGIYHNGTEELRTISHLIPKLDGVTVSTVDLAGDYSMLGAKTVECLPNNIDFEMRDWTSFPEDKDPNLVYFGFTGGVTHGGDLPIIENVVRDTLEKYDYSRFVVYTNEQTTRQLIESWDLPVEQIKFIPPVPFKDYPKYLGWFDIGLVPLENTRFNASKSNLKYIEMAARSVPVIASCVPPYAMTIKNGINGYTATARDEWMTKLSDLIENPEKRVAMGKVAYETVLEHYNMAKNARLWPEAWMNILKVKQQKAEPRIWPVRFGKMGRNDKCPCGCGKKYKQCEIYPAFGR